MLAIFSPDGNSILLCWSSAQKIQCTAGIASKETIGLKKSYRKNRGNFYGYLSLGM